MEQYNQHSKYIHPNCSIKVHSISNQYYYGIVTIALLLYQYISIEDKDKFLSKIEKSNSGSQNAYFNNEITASCRKQFDRIELAHFNINPLSSKFEILVETKVMLVCQLFAEQI